MEDSRKQKSVWVFAVVIFISFFAGFLCHHFMYPVEPTIEEPKEEQLEEQQVTLDDLIGAFGYTEEYQGDGTTLNYSFKLTINKDGMAFYDNSNGQATEATQGPIVIKGNTLTYTPKYTHYEGKNGQDNDNTLDQNEIKVLEFRIIDKNTLEYTNPSYNTNKTVQLKRGN